MFVRTMRRKKAAAAAVWRCKANPLSSLTFLFHLLRTRQEPYVRIWARPQVAAFV